MSKQEKKQKPSKKIQLTNKQKKLFNELMAPLRVKGGETRAKNLTSERRKEIATLAAKKRWAKK